MIKLPAPMQLKRSGVSKGLISCILVTMMLCSQQSWSQDNTTASLLYLKANQELTDAGLPDLSKHYTSKAGNAWYASVPLNDELRQFVASQQKAVGLVRQASRMALGNGAGEMDPTKLSQIKSSSRNIIALMLLQSRVELEKGNQEQAVSDLLSCLAMSNHIGQKAVSITKLVEIAVNQMATEAVARQIPNLPEPALQDFRGKMNQLPASSSPGEVFQNERAYAAKLMDQQKGVYPEKSVQGMLDFYEKMVDLMNLPLSEQAKEFESLSNEYAKDPFVKSLVPVLNNLRTQVQLIELRRQLLEAGVQVLLKGEDALDAIKDPHGEFSFDYSKTPNGFVLRSRLQIRGKPVSLQFGL